MACVYAPLITFYFFFYAWLFVKYVIYALQKVT